VGLEYNVFKNIYSKTTILIKRNRLQFDEVKTLEVF
jgi:hypothetical protein